MLTHLPPDGQILLLEDRLTASAARDACLKLGGSLAMLSTEYTTEYATKILMYYDYDNAWSMKPSLSQGSGN